MNERPLFIAIDANAIIHRAYHAYPSTISTTAGEQTNAVYGFTSMFLEVLKRFDPKYIVCAFDTAKPTFRHEKFADYKAHRTKPDDELIDQFPMVEKVLEAFNIPIIKREGYEADDILGAFAYEVEDGRWGTQGLDMIIVSGDKDLLQLINEHVRICLPQGSFKNLIMFDSNRTYKKYGYYPNQVVDYKAMVGDSSDNIPGIKGIGDKTARHLLDEFGSLDAVYKNLEKVDSTRVKNLLKEGLEQAEISRELAEIDREIDVGVALEDCLMRDFDKQKVLDLFVEYEFKSLIKKIPESADEQRDRINGGGNGMQLGMFAAGAEDEKSSLVGDSGKELVGSSVIEAFIKDWENCSKPCFCYLEGSEYSSGDWILMINLGAEEGSDADAENNQSLRGVNGDDGGADAVGSSVEGDGTEGLYYIDSSTEKAGEMLAKAVKGFTAGDSRETIWYKWEEFISLFRGVGIGGDVGVSKDLSDEEQFEQLWTHVKAFSKDVFDIKLASHLMYAGKKDYSLSALAFWHMSKAIRDQFGKSDTGVCTLAVSQIALKIQEKFEKIQKLWKGKAVGSSIQITENWKTLRKKYADKLGFNDNLDDPVQIQVLRNIETSVSCVLAQMENRGVLLDLKALETLEKQLSKKVSEYEKKAWDAVGHEFNLASPKQLSDIIYNELGIAPVRSGKAGRSTREGILREISDRHPLIKNVLEYREVSKIHSTYVKAFLDLVRPKVANGDPAVINTDFVQTGSSSGRFASQNPNLQNIPIVGKWADQFRQVFIPRDGYVFASIDYSQIESRFMAQLSQDELLKQNFIEDKDIHRATAAKLFNKDEDEVTKKERRIGKTVNFGVLYGQTAYGLAAQLKIPREDASKYIAEYFKSYSGVADYIEKVGEKARKLGYVETIFGRRRYISGLNASSRNQRQAAIREAINMPIQGGVSDLMKLAMILVDDTISTDFTKNGVRQVFMLLQVHDEFIFEVKEEIVDEFGSVASEIMTDIGPNLGFDVPLDVHFDTGVSLDLK